MTNEELMMPGYEAIADYPGNKYEVGTIFTYFREVAQAYDLWKDDEGNEMYSLSFSKYPHLFRRLSWWEKRKPEELPKYFRYGDWNSNHAIYEIETLNYEDRYAIAVSPVNYHLPFSGNKFYPSTKEEYETYLSNKHKQKK